uniref:WASH complex subunit strumpellin n=1 Tax=Arcella intermedia TaxID=1963864 RepID=A0A6B2KWZ9_9EUKA
MQFLHEKNVAGQTLLRLVARGNAVIAEILRLSAHIPEPFKLETKETVAKYGNIIIDFDYLEGRGKGPDYYEKVIEQNQKLIDLNAEFKDTYLKKLRRYYTLFEVIYKYGVDFIQYLDDVQKGNYIQQTLENILLDESGKQLMCEALYLFGVMLLLLDQKIDGVIRERMIISYLRFVGKTELENLDEVANLVRRTNYSCMNPPKKRPKEYPESYLNRMKLPRNVVSMIIGRLRSDDVYNQIPSYPLPEHRATALANQASMLFVCLYFAPDILSKEEAIMREIVDKHFPDNWVTTMYMGFTVDLSVEWDSYSAAKLALNNTMQPKLILDLVRSNAKRVPEVLTQLDTYLQEGTLSEEFILRNRVKLLELLRLSNVSLRWLMLHTRRASPKIISEYMKTISQPDILLLLLKTAQYEFNLKSAINAILEKKKEKWEEARKEAVERVKELSEVFSGSKALSRVEKNEKLQAWFDKISGQIQALDFEDQTVAGRRIQQMMKALEEVEIFHQIETNIPVKNYLNETRLLLGKMLRILNISQDVLVTINLVSEIGYGREIVEEYIPEMQERIKADPSSVLLLRSTFLKLASIIQNPLDRISQVSSGKEQMLQEFMAVSEYYSSELIDFVRRVLLIVPEMMFRKLSQIINIQTNEFKEVPVKIEKEEIEKYAQLSIRNKLSLLTYEVSQFTEGILALETTLVGVIQIDPKQLLEEGIRKILVRNISLHLDQTLRFENHSVQEFMMRLEQLRRVLQGFRNSFNYLQDYMNIYGLKVWQEEFQRIINFNVEQECKRFLKKVHEGTKSQYQSKIIPIPVYPPIKGDASGNFIGRVARELLTFTDPKTTLYLHKMYAWYSRDEKELVGIRTFDLLIDSIGVFGVVGLTKFYGFLIVKKLQTFVISTRTILGKDKKLNALLETFTSSTEVKSTINPSLTKLYMEVTNIAGNILDKDQHLSTIISEIGQYQLLRRHLANILNFKCKLDSNGLFCALEILNSALINDIQAHYRNPDKSYPGGEQSIVFEEIGEYLESAGLNDPMGKIYVTITADLDFAGILFILLLKQVSKFTFDAQLGMKPKKEKNLQDDAPFAVGLLTVMQQLHSSVLPSFIGLMGQYIRHNINEHVESNKATSYPPEAKNMLLFLEILTKFGSIPNTIIEDAIPAYIRSDYLIK